MTFGETGQESGVPQRESGVGRRDFLRWISLSTIALQASRMPAMAGPFETAGEAAQAASDKKLTPEWTKALFEKGTRTVYRGTDLEKIGMPIGGIGAGQLYLGGDGRLWRWDIFNQHLGTGDGNYAHPPNPDYPIEQGFTLKIDRAGKTQEIKLDKQGFPDVSFCGEYPIGTVEYRSPSSPVEVTLESFSPFIPLNSEDSSLPATVMHFHVKNITKEPVEVTLIGALENGVLLHNRDQPATRINRAEHGRGMTFLNCSAEKMADVAASQRPDTVFEDWNEETYTGWTVEGTAFGTGPIKRSAIFDYQGDVGGEGDRLVNSHASAPGNDVVARDAQTGKLTSRKFVIDRNFIKFWIGGGSHQGQTCMNLVIDGKVVRSATGRDNNRMALQNFDVRDLKGKEALLEIVDAAAGAWGNIGIGKIVLTDRPAAGGAVEDLFDWGTMGMALLGPPAEHTVAGANDAAGRTETLSGPAKKLIGELGRKIHLEPGKSGQATFVITWHFPNLEIEGLGKVGRHYAVRFKSAQDVAQYVTDNFDRLNSQTRLWRDTWYDSTLPVWFLDRTFLNSSILATSTCYRLANGRFYAWEGVGCCPGTCAHVWHYAQAMARLFPDIERDIRERVDLGVGFQPSTGVMGFRAEFDRSLAVDGQSGTLLRIYREHQMAPDSAFLKRNWTRIKQAYDPLFQLDGDSDGVLEGPQMNTLDQPWFGKISWLSSLYVAAVRAGEAMALEMGDHDFADRCHRIAEAGAKNIDSQLFNGEYYIQVRDPSKGKTVGYYDGCEIDQVFGDSWARQVGLPDILPRAHVKTALASLWKYSFLTDVGPFRAAHKPGRWYAMAGEAGLVMCSWPKGDAARIQTGFDFYFNECMTGFEYQAAGHMLAENMLLEGLAVTRAIHDRYHASRRNPWNEVECGDHYSRAMASYGVFISACGYAHHGPAGHLGFDPRLTPNHFKAAFTAAEGWGSFEQKMEAGNLHATVAPKWGHLRLKTVSLGLPSDAHDKKIEVTLNGKAIKATPRYDDKKVLLTFADELSVKTGQKLDIRIG